jgi:uncharacterized membrane protein affecting hemolysin expression
MFTIIIIIIIVIIIIIMARRKPASGSRDRTRQNQLLRALGQEGMVVPIKAQ